MHREAFACYKFHSPFWKRAIKLIVGTGTTAWLYFVNLKATSA